MGIIDGIKAAIRKAEEKRQAAAKNNLLSEIEGEIRRAEEAREKEPAQQKPIKIEPHAIYCHGHLLDTFPPKKWPYSNHIDSICALDFVASDDFMYDLTNKNAILAIAIPAYEIHAKSRVDEDMGIASSLEFLLRIKGDKYWKANNYELAIACYEKATQLMVASDEYWEEDDFFLVVNRLKELGQMERAQKWEEWLDQNIYAHDVMEEIEEEIKKEEEERAKEKEKSENHIEERQTEPNTQARADTYTVYFTNGYLSKIDPYPDGGYYENRDIANRASFIISDGVRYDLTDKCSIASIAIPSYKDAPDEEIGVTGVLDYVLRMKSGQYWNEGNYDLAIAVLEKATELMKYSSIGWPKKDFYRIVNELNDLGRFKSAKKWKSWIDDNIIVCGGPFDFDPAKRYLEEAKELGTDLCYIDWHGTSCEVCAKYQGRVYSISGKDNRFPALPDFIKETGSIHEGCRHIIRPYIFRDDKSLDTVYCKWEDMDVFEASWRPFEDDRDEEDKANREKFLKEMEKQPPIIKEPNLAKIIYLRLKVLLPEDAPKSFSGFSRMRNSNSKNYQALVKKAEAAGFIFPETLEDVAAQEDED